MIVNMTAPKKSLASHSRKHQHCSRMIFKVDIVGGVRRVVQPMGATECYAQADGQADYMYPLCF